MTQRASPPGLDATAEQQCKVGNMLKIATGNKFQMAVAFILNFIYVRLSNPIL